jgi:hypothetical protein
MSVKSLALHYVGRPDEVLRGVLDFMRPQMSKGSRVGLSLNRLADCHELRASIAMMQCVKSTKVCLQDCNITLICKPHPGILLYTATSSHRNFL